MNFHRRVQARARKIIRAEDNTFHGDAADERMARAVNQAVSEGLLRRLYRFHATRLPADRSSVPNSPTMVGKPHVSDLSAGIPSGEGR